MKCKIIHLFSIVVVCFVCLVYILSVDNKLVEYTAVRLPAFLWKQFSLEDDSQTRAQFLLEDEGETDPSLFDPNNTFGFQPINERGVYTFWNVCIEELHPPIEKQEVYDYFVSRFNETKKIVVYNSLNRTGTERISTEPFIISWSYWNLTFVSAPIPKTHRVQTNTAFFVSPIYPGNLHHFWMEILEPMYTVIRKANRLKSSARNQVFYKIDMLKNQTSFNTSLYHSLLMAFNVHRYHDVFYKVKANTCFTSAVFGTARLQPLNERDMVEQVISGFNISDDQRVAKYITFIERSNRILKNLEELVNATVEAGFQNVRVVSFEKLSLREQMIIGTTSRVLIGVNGAGLQWGIFMPPGSTVVEMSWPKKHWKFFFPRFIPAYQINYVNIEAERVEANFTSYEQEYYPDGPPLTDKQKKDLLDITPVGTKDNLWKFADVWFNKEELLNKLRNLKLKQL